MSTFKRKIASILVVVLLFNNSSFSCAEEIIDNVYTNLIVPINHNTTDEAKNITTDLADANCDDDFEIEEDSEIENNNIDDINSNDNNIYENSDEEEDEDECENNAQDEEMEEEPEEDIEDSIEDINIEDTHDANDMSEDDSYFESETSYEEENIFDEETNEETNENGLTEKENTEDTSIDEEENMSDEETNEETKENDSTEEENTEDTSIDEEENITEEEKNEEINENDLIEDENTEDTLTNEEDMISLDEEESVSNDETNEETNENDLTENKNIDDTSTNEEDMISLDEEESASNDETNEETNENTDDTSINEEESISNDETNENIESSIENETINSDQDTTVDTSNSEVLQNEVATESEIIQENIFESSENIENNNEDKIATISEIKFEDFSILKASRTGTISLDWSGEYQTNPVNKNYKITLSDFGYISTLDYYDTVYLEGNGSQLNLGIPKTTGGTFSKWRIDATFKFTYDHSQTATVTTYTDANGKFDYKKINSSRVPDPGSESDCVSVKATPEWNWNVYTVTLNNNSATSAGSTAVYQKYNTGIYKESSCSTSITSITKPTKTGYVFKGYGANTDGSGTLYINEDGTINTTNFKKTTFTANKTIYAKWELGVYTITLDASNGSGDSDGSTAVYEKYNTGIYKESGCTTAMTTSANAITKPTKLGYTFAGYYDGSTQMINANGYITSSFTKTKYTAAKTLTASWTPNVYTITLNANNGTGGTAELFEKYNTGIYSNNTCSTIASSITKPTRTGYTFKGYVANSDGSGTVYINDTGAINTTNFTNTTFTANTIIYAKWEKIVYTITLDKRSGTGGTSTLYEWYEVGIYGSVACDGVAITSITKPTRTGYTFRGYFANENGTGTVYINEDGTINTTNFTNSVFTSNKTIYAKWEENIYEITLNNNSATTAGTQKIYEKYNIGIYGELDPSCAGSIINSITIPTKTNYLFAGYYDTGLIIQYIKEDGSINQANFNKTTFAENTTMKAKWVPVYKVTLNCNGGSGVLPTEVYITSGTTDISTGVYTTVYCDTQFTNLTTIPTKAHKDFKGFVKEAAGGEGSGIEYIKENGLVNTTNFVISQFTADTIIYAKWTPAIYEITLDNDFATSAGTNLLYEKYDVGIYGDSGCSGSEVSVITKPEKIGYTFDGYYDNLTMSIQYIDASGNILFNKTTFDSATTLKAKWINNIYTIDLDDDMPTTAGIGNIYVKYNAGIYYDNGCINEVTTISKPVKLHYVFDGYYDATTLTTQYIDKNGNINSTNFTTTVFSSDDTTTHIVMKAKWIPVHKITLDKNGGDTDSDPIEIWLEEGVGIFTTEDCITNFTALTTKPTYYLHLFKGFVTNPNGTGDIYIKRDGTLDDTKLNGSTFTSDTIIYAKWDNGIYEILLDNDGASSAGTAKVYQKYNAGIFGETDPECTGTTISSITIPVKANYNFEGYYDADTMTIKYINEDGTINTTNFTNTAFIDDATIKAMWSPKIYQITLDINGGDVVGTSEIYEKYGIGFYMDNLCTEEVGSIIKPAKGIYVLDGYYENSDGTGIKYINENGTINTDDITSTTFTDNKTIYAIYTDKYVITLDTQGGETTQDILYKTHEGSIYTDENCINITTNVDIPQKAKFTFKGYFTETEGQGIEYIDGNGHILDGAYVDEDKTVYAYWDLTSKGSNGDSRKMKNYKSEGIIDTTFKFDKEWASDIVKFIVDRRGNIIEPIRYEIVGNINNGDILSVDKTYFLDAKRSIHTVNGHIYNQVEIMWDKDGKQIEKYIPNVVEEKNLQNVKENNNWTWEYDPVTNNWKALTIADNGEKIYYKNKWLSKNDKKDNNSWYVFDLNGNMMTGWVKFDGDFYYMSEDAKNKGELMHNDVIIDGIEYKIDTKTGALLNKKAPKDFEVVGAVNHKSGEDGRWIIDEKNNLRMFLRNKNEIENLTKEEPAYGWYMVDGRYYYFNEDGMAISGLKDIDGVYYYFDKEGKMVEGEEIKIGGTTYVFDKACGACRTFY